MRHTGFYPQPNDWVCGPFALKHGLWLLGIRADEGDIAKAAGTDATGTDEAELARAALNYACELQTVRRHDPVSAARDLESYLQRGVPVLLCIEQWDHWVVAACEDDGIFVVVDSRTPALFRLVPWELLQKLLVYHEGSRGRHLYDLHPLVARHPVTRIPALTLDRARFLREWDNRHVVRDWYGFLADVLEAFGDARESGVAPGVFFGRYEPALLDAVTPTNETGQRTEARRILGAMRFVADTYGWTAPPDMHHDLRERFEAVLRRRLDRAQQAQIDPSLRP
jgi:hypothetical protein